MLRGNHGRYLTSEEAKVSEHQVGPYDHDVCHFCGKSTKNDPQFTAGYQRRERFATVGPWFDACHACAEKAYEQLSQLKAANENRQTKE